MVADMIEPERRAEAYAVIRMARNLAAEMVRLGIDAGDRVHGCSVHFVTEELDDGPVVLQAEVPVLEGDTAGTLADRVHVQEHIIYPEAVRRFALGELKAE